MENNKNKAFLLGFLIFILLSLFGFGNAARNTAATSSVVKCYFQKHLTRDDRNEGLCFASRRLTKRHPARFQEFMEEFPLATQAQLIEIYRKKPSVRSIPNLPRPFDEVLVKEFVIDPNNKKIEVPLLLKATIRYSDLPRTPRGSIPNEVKTQMENMNKIPRDTNNPSKSYDENGHLLAFSLGGGMNNVWNYAPQIKRLNRHVHANPSPWRSSETIITKFLEENKQGFVDWSMVVIYDLSDETIVRPIGFCLVYSTTDNNNNQIDHYEKCFSNNPDSDCLIDERDRCYGRPIVYATPVP